MGGSQVVWLLEAELFVALRQDGRVGALFLFGGDQEETRG